MSREIPLNEQTYFNLCQTAAALGIDLNQFPWVETAGERERIIACITQKKAELEAAAANAQRAREEKRERLARLAEHLEGTHNGDVVNIGWDGHRYEIREVED